MKATNKTTVKGAVSRIGRAKRDAKCRVLRTLGVGQAVQQGDVYVHRVNADWWHGKQIGEGAVQVALGTGNGARHMAEGPVKVYAGTDLPPGMRAPQNVAIAEVCGPVIIATGEWSLTHPEHPHFRLPAGAYQVTYQYDAQTMRRVQD
jgi:hypothetical protein